MNNLLSGSNVLSILCKSTKKWGIYFHFPDIDWYKDEKGNHLLTYEEFFHQLQQAVPQLNLNDDNETMQAVSAGYGFLLFDNESEMEKVYWNTIGDDGPSSTNQYNGTVRVYALTCDPNGQTLNENT